MRTEQTGLASQAVASDASPPGELSTAEALTRLFESLASQQCALTGADAAIIYLSATASRPAGVAALHTNPGGGIRTLTPDSPTLKRLVRLAEASASSGAVRSEASSVDDETGIYHAGSTHTALACPLVAAEQTHGACALLLPGGDTPIEPKARAIELTIAQYEAFVWKQQAMSESHARIRLREALELLDASQQGSDAPAMGALFCHELHRRFGCTRVSIGLVRRRAIKLAATSTSDDISATGAAADALEQAMEECAMQDIEVVHPPTEMGRDDPSQQRITRAHEQLSERFGPAAIISLPLRVEGDIVGVVTLEREPTDPFPLASVPLLRLIAEFIGPALWTRRMADRGVLAVTRDRAIELAMATVGPRHTGLKTIVATLLLILIACVVLPIPGRISAGVEVHASTVRYVPAPYQGYLAEVLVRPGDEVSAGTALARMDTAELELDLERERGRHDALQTQYDQHLEQGATGEAAVAFRQLQEADVSIRQLTRRIERATITAPIDGTISRGESEILTGAFIEPTTPLFEIVSLDEPILVLQVDEADVARLGGLFDDAERSEPDGWFALSARPGTKVPIRITGIRPVAETIRGGNKYLVEATPIDPPDDMVVLPGLTGTARLKTGPSTVAATVLRPLTDDARLSLWW